MSAEHAGDRMIEHKMAAVLKRRGVRAVFFDMDDTLIITGKVFEKYILDYSKGLSTKCGKDSRYIFTFFINTLKELKKVFSVNPALIIESARITALHLGVDYYSPDAQMLVASLMEVYEGHGARPAEGTNWVLDVLRRIEIERVSVTHAGEDNTYKKMKIARINPRDFSHIFCLDDLGEKGPDEWAYSLQQAGYHPHEVMVVGDNWLADVQPALEIGVPVEQVIRIRGDRIDLEDHFIEGVAQLNNVGELPEHIALKL